MIAFSQGAGVLLNYSTIGVLSNSIRGNSIYGNGRAHGTGAGSRSPLGIDLGNSAAAEMAG